MNIATKQSYRKLSSHFFSRYVVYDGQSLEIDQIVSSLKARAEHLQPAYFRRLKNAIAFDLTERGYPDAAKVILSVVNPVTAKGSVLTPKAKPLRAKCFSDQDFADITAHLVKEGLHAVWAALALIRITGARPAELNTLMIRGDAVFISGAKKSHDGARGADRILTIQESHRETVENCIAILKSEATSITAIRHRLREQASKLWPRRKTFPSMYSMRHQFGSNLKATNMDARTVAYIMGHQNTSSIKVYGGRRQGDPLAIHVSPAQGESLERIRQKVRPEKIERFERMIFRPPTEPSSRR